MGALKSALYPDMDDERSKYLDELAEEYGIDSRIVYMLADLLGPSEDRDGLVAELEDLDGTLYIGE